MTKPDCLHLAGLYRGIAAAAVADYVPPPVGVSVVRGRPVGSSQGP